MATDYWEAYKQMASDAAEMDLRARMQEAEHRIRLETINAQMNAVLALQQYHTLPMVYLAFNPNIGKGN